jgi:DNA-binding CsgD family transcriptional regulator
LEDLTPRQREIVVLIIQGLTNEEIATKLCIKPKSVQGHLTRIFGKYHLKNRTQICCTGTAARLGARRKRFCKKLTRAAPKTGSMGEGQMSPILARVENWGHLSLCGEEEMA